MKISPSFLFYSLIALFVAGGVASCSQSDEVSALDRQGDKIAFTVTSEQPKRQRATAITPGNLNEQMKGFKLWSYYSTGGTYYTGKAGAAGVVLNGDGKGKWDYNNVEETAYWPANALNFYAVTPSEHTGFTFSDDGKLTYVVPEDQARQTDLMVAKADNQTKTTNAGAVNLQFKHLLSQVAFTVKAAHPGMTVEVKSITLHNIQNTLTTTLKGSTADVASGAYTNYAVGLTTPVTADNSAAVRATDANGVLLLVPQTVTKWVDGTTVSKADEAHQGYLALVCKIKQGDNYLVGSATEYGTTYAPFEATWEAGKKYTYDLNIGGGKDEQGTQLLDAITLNVSTEAWTGDTGNDNQGETGKSEENTKQDDEKGDAKDNNQGETTATYEFVDLGLSVEWATCNVGASKPEELGTAFEANASQIGSITGLLNVPEGCRLPTNIEVKELLNQGEQGGKKTKWDLISEGNLTGYKVSSVSNASKNIFLPMEKSSEVTYYWTGYDNTHNYYFLWLKSGTPIFDSRGDKVKGYVRLVRNMQGSGKTAKR